MEEGNKLLFLGRRYELGDVIDYLRDFTYGVTAVGLHFGMDETRLYRCSPRGDGEWEAKMLSHGGGYAVPNLICYENGRPVIGEAARNRQNVIDSFNKGTFEDKYLKAFDGSDELSVSLNANGSNIDLSKLEDDVRNIRKQNEVKYYTMPNGTVVMQYKNIKRIIKN